MRIRVIVCLMIAIGCTIALPGAGYAKKPKITVHVHQSSKPVVWNKSTFHVSQNGRVYANHYNHQTLRDFAGLLQSYGTTDISFIPAGQQGAIPNHLRDYAYGLLLEHGIRVTNYQPHHCLVHWGYSTFHISHEKIYSDDYNHQTLIDFADLHAYLGIRKVRLMSAGQRGAVPNHLRPYAIQRLNQRGIQVTHAQAGHASRPSHKKKRVKPEDVMLEAFVDIVSSHKHR